MTDIIDKPGFYKRRDGKKVECLAIRNGRAIFDGGAVIPPYARNSSTGKYDPYRDSSTDIIGPWVEPDVIDRWLNVYKKHTGQLWTSRDDADKCSGRSRIACIHIRITPDAPVGERVKEVIDENALD